MGKKKRGLAIDADHILYFVCESRRYKDTSELGGEDIIDENEVDLAPYITHFKEIVHDYVTTAEVESICYKWKIGKVRVILSDKTNFRYEIFPEYKKDRPSSPILRKRLAEWARKEYIVHDNVEGDDVVAHYVRKGAIGFTTDKDLFKGVAGLWFNSHYMHRTWNRTTPEEAEFFFKCQILAGDGVDGIPSIDGVGIKTAEKLLEKYGDSYKDIQLIFKDVNKVVGKTPRRVSYGRDYFIQMARLVSMTQWHPKKGITLWTPPLS